MYTSNSDINMGYYHIELSPGDKHLCKIVLPWGKHEYQNLPMGVYNILDISQEKISKLFDGFEMWRVSAQDVPFDIILWYIEKTIPTFLE